MPLNDSVGPDVIALGRVVVDDVEDHLDAGLVQRLDHLLEVLHLLSLTVAMRVLVVRREVADRVVAPVVAQPSLDEVRVVDEFVDRQHLEGGDAESLEVLDEGRVGDAGIAAAQLFVDVGMEDRRAFDVGLVDDSLGPRQPERLIGRPIEVRIDDDARGEFGALSVVSSRSLSSNP